ncbi:MAG: transposase [Novipirellula sp. JB048]
MMNLALGQCGSSTTSSIAQHRQRRTMAYGQRRMMANGLSQCSLGQRPRKTKPRPNRLANGQIQSNNGDHAMPQSLSQLYAHLIFSTKDRFPFLKDDIRDRVHRYLATVLRDMGSPFVVVGGVEDHVHLLFDLGRIHPAKDFVEILKRESSKFTKTLSPNLDKFYWQRGYGIFSVSPTHRGNVVAYLKNQPEHHRHKTFQEEYRGFLIRYGIEFDEQYVWD